MIGKKDLFPDSVLVRDMQKELDCLIQMGVAQITKLLINSETKVSRGTSQAVEAEENQSSNTPVINKIRNKNLFNLDVPFFGLLIVFFHNIYSF